MFICGQFVGRRKVHRNSIAGLLLAGNYVQGIPQATEMISKIEKQIAANAPRADAGSPPAGSPSAGSDSA
ncbi:MAG: hypothetical protein HUU38_09000 [Anaerolineales bacterium]|nr:hypothetical protein [Anaerolineales bacterium]